MEGQIPEQVKVARSHILIDLGRQQKQKFMEYYLGRNVEILFEEQAEIHGKTYWIGHTREYLKVAADTKENLENCSKNWQNWRICRRWRFYLRNIMVEFPFKIY